MKILITRKMLVVERVGQLSAIVQNLSFCTPVSGACNCGLESRTRGACD